MKRVCAGDRPRWQDLHRERRPFARCRQVRRILKARGLSKVGPFRDSGVPTENSGN